MHAAVANAVLDDSALAELAASFRGPLVRPADAEYDEQRKVWNGSIDRRPALILRCLGVADVLDGIRLAGERQLPLAVRGGGHSIAGFGTCDGGVVLDLSPMKSARVDPQARTAQAEAPRVGDLRRVSWIFRGGSDRSSVGLITRRDRGRVGPASALSCRLHRCAGLSTMLFALKPGHLVPARVPRQDHCSLLVLFLQVRRFEPAASQSTHG